MQLCSGKSLSCHHGAVVSEMARIAANRLCEWAVSLHFEGWSRISRPLSSRTSPYAENSRHSPQPWGRPDQKGGVGRWANGGRRVACGPTKGRFAPKDVGGVEMSAYAFDGSQSSSPPQTVWMWWTSARCHSRPPNHGAS
eukprot:scaffold68193_cov33-Tisochrysis_lutea.AAC.3